MPSCPGRGRTVCDIAIHDGKIAAILAPGEAVPAARGDAGARACRHAGRRRCPPASRSRQGYRTPARTAGCRPRDGGRGKGRRHHLHSLSDGDRAVRGDFRRCRRGHRSKARASISAITSSSATEAQLAGVARYVARLRRAELQDLHEQPRRRRRPPRAAGYRRRLSVPAVRGRGQKWRHGLSASGNDRNRLGVARPAESERSRRPRRPENLERHPPAVRRGRCGAARGLCRPHGGGAALCRPYLVSGSAGGGASPSPCWRHGAYRDVPALSHA